MGNYTSLTKTISTTWQDTTNLSGVASASLVVVFVVSTGIGAMTGLALGGQIAPALLAIIAGFLGTVVAGDVAAGCLLQNNEFRSFRLKVKDSSDVSVGAS
jgi:hypothetical protein